MILLPSFFKMMTRKFENLRFFLHVDPAHSAHVQGLVNEFLGRVLTDEALHSSESINQSYLKSITLGLALKVDR